MNGVSGDGGGSICNSLKSQSAYIYMFLFIKRVNLQSPRTQCSKFTTEADLVDRFCLLMNT